MSYTNIIFIPPTEVAEAIPEMLALYTRTGDREHHPVYLAIDHTAYSGPVLEFRPAADPDLDAVVENAWAFYLAATDVTATPPTEIVRHAVELAAADRDLLLARYCPDCAAA
jgi:hypothetical protein